MYNLNEQILLLLVEAESCKHQSDFLASRNRLESIILSMAADSYLKEALELTNKLPNTEIN